MLHFRSLASGSSGNAFLLQTDKVNLLFDAGLRLSALIPILDGEGVTPDKLTGILISHEHRDHCAAAFDLAQQFGVPVWANWEALRAAGLHGVASAAILEVGVPALFGDVEVVSFPVSHDAVRPVGFMVRVQRRTVVLATDLGCPTPLLSEAVALADLVVLESNHDLDMLHAGRYPLHLRRRVAGPTGHLANAEAADILIKNVKGDGVEVWLAHLSRNNNTTALARRTVTGRLKAMGLGALRVQVARRDKPSLSWSGALRPTQLGLFRE